MDDKAAAPTADAATETETGNELSTADHTTVTMEPVASTSKSTITEMNDTERHTAAAASAEATARDVLNVDTERCCWICFATDEDNRLAAWVQPCQCRGTTKWVHQSCLYRWIDEKTQKGSALRSVSCPQCQTEYIIVFPQMGKLGGALEAMDTLVKRLSPFLAAGFFVGSLYWTAVTYGAVTFLQIVGHEHGMSIMEAGDPLILLIGLPAIPVGLVLGRLIRWEDALLRLIRNRGTVMRKFPFVNFIYPNLNQQEEELPTSTNPATPALSDPVSATRIFCGALLLPTISCIVGRILFDSVENTLHRTLLGGLTFITVKGMLKIYLKQKQYARRKKRRIVDYTEENIRNFMHRNNNNAGAAGIGGARHILQQQQQQQPQQPAVAIPRLVAAAAANRDRAAREREHEPNSGDSVV
ncbi:E3 ubiquitin-protein ligase MARCH5 [Drosophila hydei]|uniref:E3 ubiquitin-protein ligase MARCHF5 n=1 Tax=Drosophila hydei TaxID=7224 RepID=A0A6J1M650_DROHY|nr:E3 ubiquitin-protein ligase MARCH5 [Drosophila hydei]XP_023174632.2 E3 ubiquitin-protein ligase MARCH5 [Drosophila hydei]